MVGASRSSGQVPPDAVALFAHAGHCERNQQPDEAGALYRAVMGISPDLPEAYNNFGILLYRRGWLDLASAYLLRALILRPATAETWNNLGLVLRDRARIDEAEICFRWALVSQPALSAAYNNLGEIFLFGGQQELAVRCYDRALLIDPMCRSALGNRVFAWLYRSPALSPLFAEARRWSETHAEALPRQDHPVVAIRQEPRLGFVSGDFRGHAVGFLTLPAIERLSQSGYSITCYSNGGREDELTARFRRAATDWRLIAGLTDEAVSRQIVADGIDILFDLSGLTAQGRPLAFARKPAPVQIAWVGYPATTGMPTMDYILADHHQVPAGAEKQYSERVIRLPDSYVTFAPPPDSPPLADLPALRNGFVTFGSFNGLKKISPQVVAVWSRIVAHVPDARLLIKAPALEGAGVRRRYRDLFAAFGVESSRLTFLGATSPRLHRSSMAEVDIALDSFPYSGGQTTLEVLWMGLPVITCPGETFASRHSLGYLSTLGLGELIATDINHYVALAVELASSLPRLVALRTTMRRRMLVSPLCDADGFTRDLKTALSAVWRRHCQGLPPATVDVRSDGSNAFAG